MESVSQINQVKKTVLRQQQRHTATSCNSSPNNFRSTQRAAATRAGKEATAATKSLNMKNHSGSAGMVAKRQQLYSPQHSLTAVISLRVRQQQR